MKTLLIALTLSPSLHTFGGYDCHNDCAMMAAGYSWAVEHGVMLLGTCQNKNEDFKNGCMTYLADPFRGSVQDDQGTDIDQ